MNRHKKYNEKCKFFCFRFRKEYDQKYIDFLNNQENKTGWIKKQIDKEISE